jgi:hypothetical protein
MLVPFVIWTALDVPDDYNPCYEDEPPGQAADLSAFRSVAYPLVGLLTIWLTFLFTRIAFERERRVGHPDGRAAIGLVAFVWTALALFALGAADTTLGWVITASLFVGAGAFAAAVLLALAVPAYLSAEPFSTTKAERGDRLVLLLAASLLTAVPILAASAALTGSDFVIGC